jgi:hypothetical protein
VRLIVFKEFSDIDNETSDNQEYNYEMAHQEAKRM